MWVVGSKARMSWADFQGQDEMTRLSQNVPLHKEKDGEMAEFSEN
jgi:hypothetical protein